MGWPAINGTLFSSAREESGQARTDEKSSWPAEACTSAGRSEQQNTSGSPIGSLSHGKRCSTRSRVSTRSSRTRAARRRRRCTPRARAAASRAGQPTSERALAVDVAHQRVALSAAWRRGGRLGRAEHRRGVLRGRQREVEQLAVAESAEQVLVRRLVSGRLLSAPLGANVLAEREGAECSAAAGA